MRKGKGPLIAYLQGEKIHRSAAVKAKCYDCDGMGETGECDIVGCALYPFSPYRPHSLRAGAKKKGIVEEGGEVL
jgi:hypothetical protein